MKWLKRGAGALLILVLALASAIGAGLMLGERRAARHIDIRVEPVALRSDPAALERGHYLYASRGCEHCHGDKGAGASIADNGKDLKLAGPNLTSGNPRLAAYAPQDWVRSIRHGVSPEGRALRVMPSKDYNRLTDDDLASVVAYVRHFPPQSGREQAIVELPLPARVLYGFGAIPEAAVRIDHSLPPSRPVPEGVTVAYGEYVAQMCHGCHGPTLLGGKIAGAPPDQPAAPRLPPGPGSVMPRYPDTGAFLAMLRTGKRPDGSAIAVMPFSAFKVMNETDLRALHLYLAQLSAP